MKKWIAVFRTGQHKDSKGREHIVTDKDLEHIASSYNSEKFEAPLVIGHPKTDDPAYGWVDKVKRIGDKLYILPKQVNSNFKEMVNRGAFKKISISLFPDKTLRHIGFLGAAAPAVQGLPTVQFNQDDSNLDFELGEAPLEFSDNEQSENIDELKAKIQEFNALAKTLEAKNKELSQIIASGEFNSYLDKKCSEGYLTPAQKTKASELLEFASSSDDFCFSSGEKKSPVAIVKEFIDLLGKQMEFSEAAGKKESAGKSLREKLVEEVQKTMGVTK